MSKTCSSLLYYRETRLDIDLLIFFYRQDVAQKSAQELEVGKRRGEGGGLNHVCMPSNTTSGRVECVRRVYGFQLRLEIIFLVSSQRAVFVSMCVYAYIKARWIPVWVCVCMCLTCVHP